MRKVSVAAIVASALGVGLLFTPSAADAFRVYKLQGNQWAIVCTGGGGYSFSGSATGAGEVGGLLCPGESQERVVLTNPTKGGANPAYDELLRADRFVTRAANGRYALVGGGQGQGNVAFRGYPPHGYPCLGCAPCPGSNPVEYCDITAILHPGAASAGWRVNAQGRIVRVETASPTTR